MRFLNVASGGLLLTLAGLAVFAQNNELQWTMERAVKQLDQQASDLESVLSEAEVTWQQEPTSGDYLQSGRAFFDSRGNFRINPTESGAPVVLLKDSTVYYHDAAAKQVREYRLSQHKNRIEPFLPMGFTITGKKLEKDFLVTFIGEDSFGDRRALGLELTPKDNDVRAVVSKMTIWFDEASWLPAKQIIEQSGGAGTVTIIYTGTARNLSLNPDLFSTRWPRGTNKQRM